MKRSRHRRSASIPTRRSSGSCSTKRRGWMSPATGSWAPMRCSTICARTSAGRRRSRSDTSSTRRNVASAPRGSGAGRCPIRCSAMPLGRSSVAIGSSSQASASSNIAMAPTARASIGIPTCAGSTTRSSVCSPLGPAGRGPCGRVRTGSRTPRPREPRTTCCRVRVDLLVMGGRCQADWEHSVPYLRGREPVGIRISLQWRATNKTGEPFLGASYRASVSYGHGRAAPRDA